MRRGGGEGGGWGAGGLRGAEEMRGWGGRAEGGGYDAAPSGRAQPAQVVSRSGRGNGLV